MMFPIPLKTLFGWGLILLYGLSMIFIYNGITGFIDSNFNVTWGQYLSIGIILALTLAIVFKIKLR